MTPKILLIDDSVAFTDMAQRALRDRAFVTAAATLADARAKIIRGSWNAILVDFHLRDGKGIELLPLINEHHPRARVHIISGDPGVLAEISGAGGAMSLKGGGLAPLLAVVDQCVADMEQGDGRSTGTRRRSLGAIAADYGADHGLTPREIEVVAQATTGMSQVEIAQTLEISEKTLEGHVTKINRKTGKSRLLEVVAEVLRRAG